MIERTTMSTSSNNTPYLIYHRAGADNGIVGGNISGTTDNYDPGVSYPLVVGDNSGDTGAGGTATRMTFRDLKFNGEIFDAHTTINGGITLPTGTITVVSTSTFAASGNITIGAQTVAYTGKTGTTFTGCTGGTGAVANGANVTQSSTDIRRAICFDWQGTFFYGQVFDNTIGNVEYFMKFDNEGSHCVKESGNFVDEVATSRYTGATAYQRANFATTTSGTLNTRRGQIKYFYAGGAANLTNIDISVETGYIVYVQFYAARTVKHGTGNIQTQTGADVAAVSGDFMAFVHDGAGTFWQI
jgi:hypothetical protein